MVPGGAFTNPTSANASKPPNFLSAHHQSAQSAAPRAPEPPAEAAGAQEPWAGFPARASAGAPQPRTSAGGPRTRAAPEAHAQRLRWPPLAVAHPPRHPPQQAGHPWQSPPYLLCCLLALGLPTATLLSRWLTARDLATGSEPAVQATPPCAAPSRAPAFLFLLLSAQAPAQHVSRAARLPGSLESRLPPHPRPGAARRPSRRSPRVLALIHT